MSKQMEIERKFLIEIPKLNLLDIRKDMDIIQVYLTNGKQGSQRRVRKITEGNNEKYFYTEKTFISSTQRIENESEISKQEYHAALKDSKKECTPVAKRRICFNYSEQLFEMDIYPFSSELAILELELDSLSQEIYFPEYIRVIKEVSDDKRYSNAELATAGAFPSDIF